MSAALWLLAAVPLGAGAVLLTAHLMGRTAGAMAERAWAAPAAALTAASTCLALAVVVAVGRPRVTAPLFAGIPATLAVDGLTAVMVVTVAAVTLAVVCYSVGEFGGEEPRARFFGLLLLFAGAMLLTVTATTLAVLLMAWEVMGAASYALIGFWWHQPRRVAAGTTAFLTTRAADVGLYLAAGAAFAGGGSMAFDRLPATASPWLALVAAGVVAAALGKSAQLPVSFWLSRAMEGPSPVSALLHSATMVAAGAYLLLRLHPVLAAVGWAEPLVASVGGVTALLLGLVAVAQRDLKQLLAASTCAQIGFVVLAAGAGGVAGGTMHLVGHAAVKSLLFLAAGAWLSALGTKRLDALRGAARRWPAVGAAFLVGALALAGLPPLSLWVTKDEALSALLERWPALYALGLAASVVGAVYATKAVVILLGPPPSADEAEVGYDTEQPGTRRVGFAMRLPLVALAVPAAALGVLGLPPVSAAMARAVGQPDAPSARGWELAASAVGALTAAALTWWWGGRPVPLPRTGLAGLAGLTGWLAGWLAGWLHLEALARLVVVRPTLALARALARFDDHILDAAVEAVARAGRGAAQVADRRVEPVVDGAVDGVGAGARRLARLARRPQTGLAHQYYAQLAATVLLLALVFVLVR